MAGNGVSEFFQLLDDFLTDVGESFPSELTHIKTYQRLIDGARRANGRLFIAKFMDVIGPYEKEIMDCDEEHFLSLDPTQIDPNISSNDLELITIIKDIWRTPSTTDKTKASIWAYLQALARAGKEIVSGKNQPGRFQGF